MTKYPCCASHTMSRLLPDKGTNDTSAGRYLEKMPVLIERGLEGWLMETNFLCFPSRVPELAIHALHSPAANPR